MLMCWKHKRHMIDNLIKSLATRYPSIAPLLNNNARRQAGLELKALDDINAQYHDTVTEALTRYFEGGSVTGPRNKFREAATEAFYEAFGLGWEDGGGEYPIDDEAEAWRDERLQEEYTHIDELFETAKELRRDKEFDFFEWVTARADGYTKTLSAIYAQGKMMASKNKVLEFGGEDGEESCEECKGLKGKRMRISTILARGLIPSPGNPNFTCQGYKCEHYWFDPKTGERYSFE